LSPVEPPLIVAVGTAFPLDPPEYTVTLLIFSFAT
jgi:hypothetical protein